ncbi:MAG: DUF3360 domain-containing protein [Clostridia bacterium]|nr:DUF3360 domain-containing protein [Clostridia bacterium]
MRKDTLRQETLQEDLIAYSPKKWAVNFPLINYNLRFEDIIPALSGAIGKVAMAAAFAVAWAKALGIDNPAFVIENVRLEIIVGSIITIIFCALLNPYMAPPGTLAPLVSLIPVMAAAGVHPLALGILIGVIGFLISISGYIEAIVKINGPGTKGGIILLFGFMGISSSLQSLKGWAVQNNTYMLFEVLIIVGLILFVILSRLGVRWLMIPSCALAALIIPAVFNIYPSIGTSISFPTINPDFWWNKVWGIGWGISVENFIRALPFALLAIVMWPTDALAIRTIQEANYGEGSEKAVFDMNSTFIAVSLRNLIGAFLGGAQTSAVWRSFMIPLATVRRPIGGSALLLGVVGILFGILGAPLDIAVFPPLIWLVLIFGVYIPLMEVGLNAVKNAEDSIVAAICIVVGIALNPVLGWAAAATVENFGIIKRSGSRVSLTIKDKVITAIAAAIAIVSYFIVDILF